MGQCFRSYVLRWSQRIRDDTVQQMLQSYEYCQLVASMLMLFMMVLCSVLFYDRCALCFICLSSLARSTFVRFLLDKNDIKRPEQLLSMLPSDEHSASCFSNLNNVTNSNSVYQFLFLSYVLRSCLLEVDNGHRYINRFLCTSYGMQCCTSTTCACVPYGVE
jgi:hypothetical protein